MKHSRILTFSFLACSTAFASWGQESGVKPDNTKTNKRDRSAAEVTADQQKMNPADRELTQKIRQSIVADKSPSTYAHNIKIISQNGLVTLKGPVKSDEEKKIVIAKAVEITGKAQNVTDQVSVAQ